MNNPLMWSGAQGRIWKDGDEKVISSFSSPSFDVVTTATMTNAALADDDKAPAKDGSKEEAADETAGETGSSTIGGQRRWIRLPSSSS